RMVDAVTCELVGLQLGQLLAFGKRVRHRLAGHLRELGLEVEGLQMRRSTGLIKENDALSLGRKVERIHDAGGGEHAPVEERVQAQQADAGKAVTQKSAAANFSFLGFRKHVN